MAERTVAALYVLKDGPYSGLPGVDCWDEERDARTYAGPHPVVAHPPCARWGRYWSGGPSAKVRRELGDDGGCFAAALESVREYGGVLEHPEASHAWRAFGLAAPFKSGGWMRAGLDDPGWTCCVEQGHYGHRARKATWLYAVGLPELPSFKWGSSGKRARLEAGFHSTEERRAAGIGNIGARGGKGGSLSNTVMSWMPKRERMITPPAFRDLLLSMARSVHG